MKCVLVLVLAHFVFKIEGNGPEKFCDNSHVHARIKRAKNYYGPPSKFYKLPPAVYPVNGPFSYTPPPGYEIKERPQTANLKPYKVNKRPTTSGLEDEDLHNIVKYLSKQDLDKVFELARVKDENFNGNAESSNHNFEFDRPNTKYENDGRESINKAVFKFTDPYVNYNYESSRTNYEADPLKQKLFSDNGYSSDESRLPPKKFPRYTQSPEDDGDVVHDIYMEKEIINTPHKETMYIENDSDIAFTNKVPKIIKSESTSYKLENFAELPLMNYDSKLHKVNSYNVPHYTIVSQNQYQQKRFPTLPAHPSSSLIRSGTAAKNQSEAHLTAIQIWTHKSKGTAYTVNDDGTLTLEKPTRY